MSTSIESPPKYTFPELEDSLIVLSTITFKDEDNLLSGVVAVIVAVPSS